MYSEFTLNLIEEVKKRPILYNTKYDKRPKPEKEEAWTEISFLLQTSTDKCKKHWKNVRDRYVKVMHLRNRHFLNKGNELNAPQYIYFDKMNFMQEFSKKEATLEPFPIDVSCTMDDISPERLIYEDKEPNRTPLLDYTARFFELVKDHPCLYDEHAEFRKYRSKDAWRQVAENLSGKFTVGHLRHYWIAILKKYKLYLEHFQTCPRGIENEEVFNFLSFTKVGLQHEDKKSSTNQYILLDDDLDENEELSEENQLLCEVVDTIHDTQTDEEFIVKCNYQDHPDIEALESVEVAEPEAKRLKPNSGTATLTAGTYNDQPDHHSAPPDISSTESLKSTSLAQYSQVQNKSLNMNFLQTLAPTMDALPLSAQLKLRANFMNLLAEEVAKMEDSIKAT